MYDQQSEEWNAAVTPSAIYIKRTSTGKRNHVRDNRANIAYSSRSVPSSNAVFLSEVQLLFSIACSISSPLSAMHLGLVHSCKCGVKINK